MSYAAPHKAVVFLTLSLALHIFLFTIFDSRFDISIDKQGASNIEVELSKKNKSRASKQNKQPGPAASVNKDIVKTLSRQQHKKQILKAATKQATEKPPLIAVADNSHEIKPATPQTNSESNIDTQKVAAILNSELSRYFYYPKAAQRRNWQGQVLLEFVILADGDITRIKISKSSGYSLLDKAAIDALDKIEKQEQLALALNGHNLAQILPVSYRLLHR